MRVLRIVAGVLVAGVALIALLFGAARLGDGPLGPLPGGPLEGGELVREPVEDWSFATSIEEIELQLADESSSRTTWIIVDGGRAYIPCATSFPPGKDWYRRADQRGDALVRIDGRRYPVHLARVHDDAERASVGTVARAKYPNVPPGEGELWLFAVTSRAS